MSENVEVAEKKLNTIPSKTGKNPNSRVTRKGYDTVIGTKELAKT